MINITWQSSYCFHQPLLWRSPLHLSKSITTRNLLQLLHKHPTFRCVHALLHGASGLKHRCFEVSHSREHFLKTTTPWYDATLWVGILRNLRKHLRKKKAVTDACICLLLFVNHWRIQGLAAHCVYDHSYTTVRPSQPEVSRHQSSLLMRARGRTWRQSD